jgi:hypothetical protein
VVTQADGSQLVEFWAKRAPLYPQSRPDSLNRFIHDALNFGLDPLERHLGCARYVIENKISRVVSPTLVIGSGKDPYSYPQVDQGMVPLMEMYPQEVASAVTEVLAQVHSR